MSYKLQVTSYKKFFLFSFSILQLIACNFLLSSCGFHPVYGVNKYTAVGAETKLQSIEISNIPDREGQYLRNALIDRFYRDGRPENPIYRLDINKVEESKLDLDITKTADTTRSQLRLNTNFTLYDTRTNKILLTRKVQSVTSYNVLGSEFATRVSEDNTRLNALNDLAQQIEIQITLFFKRP